MNIGVIAYGIVGKAVVAGFQKLCRIYVYDSNPRLAAECSLSEKTVFCRDVDTVIKNAEFIFICVPTPRRKGTEHSFDSTHLDNTLHDIAQSESIHPEHTIILKSTVVPSKVKEYLIRYPQLNLVVCPEFLVEKNSIHCFLSPDYRIYGGADEQTRKVHGLFEKYSICTPCKIAYTDHCSAAIIKYMINSFLAIKVSFMNQFHDLARLSGTQTSWQKLTEIFHYDNRTGNSHADVPGHDGKRGWGGKCLPKDISAIMSEAKAHNCNLDVLQAVWDYNRSLRDDID